MGITAQIVTDMKQKIETKDHRLTAKSPPVLVNFLPS
jgi:hypothetical protein